MDLIKANESGRGSGQPTAGGRAGSTLIVDQPWHHCIKTLPIRLDGPSEDLVLKAHGLKRYLLDERSMRLCLPGVPERLHEEAKIQDEPDRVHRHGSSPAPDMPPWYWKLHEGCIRDRAKWLRAELIEDLRRGGLGGGSAELNWADHLRIYGRPGRPRFLASYPYHLGQKQRDHLRRVADLWGLSVHVQLNTYYPTTVDILSGYYLVLVFPAGEFGPGWPEGTAILDRIDEAERAARGMAAPSPG